MIGRRSFVSAVGVSALASLVGPAYADIGLSAPPELFNAIKSLPGISEGHGRGTLYILFAPWCSAMPQFYSDTRAFLDEIEFRWIPFSGGQPEGRIETERLLKSGKPADIPKSFSGIKTGYQVNIPTPLSDAQDERMEPVRSLVFSNTGRGVSTPSLAYQRGVQRFRFVHGSLDTGYLRELTSYIE